MTHTKYLNLDFEQLALKGKQILAQQLETTYNQALQQVKMLKSISKVDKSEKKHPSKKD